MEPQNAQVMTSNIEQVDSLPLARKRLMSFFTNGLILRGLVWFFSWIITPLFLFGDNGANHMSSIFNRLEPFLAGLSFLYPIVFIITFLLGLRAFFLENFINMDKFIKIGSMWRWIFLPNILLIITVIFLK